ncbi:repetitive organellar protein [Adelges cooleyi]|uniref:repetitive organellar protein n=1 Tax=Adelges cooleyi TaxID=133065 RepID=UPI0021805A43|nr:repetitive organellar protein [Adelges cooleyi]
MFNTNRRVFRVYQLPEVFNDNSKPTKTEIEEHASRIGIDPVKDIHLLHLAKQCLLEPLPSDWIPCYIEQVGKYFYYNTNQNTSQWEHPLDNFYRQIVEKKRSEDSSTGQDISTNRILEEDSPPDAMYSTKNIYDLSNNSNKKPVAEKRTVRFKTPIEESLDFDNSEDNNMKFLGPIKLNTPYSSQQASQNLPVFSSSTPFDFRIKGSRSVLSKYNVLSNKEELLTSGNKDSIEKELETPAESSVVQKENTKKINITLTESSDHSESTSLEECLKDFDKEYGDNADGNCSDGEIKYNGYSTTTQLEKHSVKNDFPNEARTSSNELFKSTKNKDTLQIKKSNMDESVHVENYADNINRDISSLTVLKDANSLSAIQGKTIEKEKSAFKPTITSIEKIQDTDEYFVDLIPKRSNENYETKTISHHERANKNDFSDHTNIELQIESQITKQSSIIKEKIEDDIRTKETLLRNDVFKKMDDLIQLTNENNSFMEKRIYKMFDEFYKKKNEDLEKTLKNMKEDLDKKILDENEKHDVQCSLNNQKMNAETYKKLQDDLENNVQTLKSEIESKTNKSIQNLIIDELSHKSKTAIAGWDQAADLYKMAELEKVKFDIEQKAENVKRHAEKEIERCNKEFDEKLKVISNDKLKNADEALNLALCDQIELVQKRVKGYYDNQNNTTKNNFETNIHATNVSVQKSNDVHTENTDVFNSNKIIDIKKKIQHCFDELNNILLLVNDVSYSESDRPRENEGDGMNSQSNKCTVSCQTDNFLGLSANPHSSNYPYPNSLHFSAFKNDNYDFESMYTENWNQAKSSKELFTNYMIKCSRVINPVDNLSQEELKVNAAEKNIFRLIDAFEKLRYTDVNHNSEIIPTNNYFHHHGDTRYINSRELTPNQIAYNRTKDLRKWLYKTDTKNTRLY